MVIVLSDLDIGMNLHMCDRFPYPTEAMNRGKVLDAEALEKVGAFKRYADLDLDGVPYRTLPGTRHPAAAYFTRGTGHDESGLYSENPEIYKKNMDRLARKWETARTMVPKPVSDVGSAKIGLLYYGSTHEAATETRFLLQKSGIEVNVMRIRAIPFTPEVEEFLDRHDESTSSNKTAMDKCFFFCAELCRSIGRNADRSLSTMDCLSMRKPYLSKSPRRRMSDEQ